MTHPDMPKQLYKEEVIERVVDFSRHQIMESMRAWDPSYRALHKPNENGPYDGGEDEEEDVEFGSPNKKRRGSRSVKGRRPTGKWKQGDCCSKRCALETFYSPWFS